MNLLYMIKQALIKAFSVRKGVRLAKDVHVGPFSILWSPTTLSIGRRTYIGKFCTIQTSGQIGAGVLIANSVGIVGRLDHEYRIPGVPVHGGRWVGSDTDLATLPANEVHIEDDVWIGYGSTVLSGVRIGEGAIIAAGSTVIDDVGAYEIVAGAPARKVAMRFEGDPCAIQEHRNFLKRRFPGV